MFNKKRLIKSIKSHEGYSDSIYIDILGNPTIGFGHLVKKRDNLTKNKKYSKKYLNQIFEKDLTKAIKHHNKIFSKYNLPKKINEVLIEMIFQLGFKNILKFKKMLRALKKTNFKTASKEMISSKWYTQTPKRVKKLARIVLNEHYKK